MASASSLSSTCVPSLMKDEKWRNWAELPPEVTSSILLRLGAIEILQNAQKVCKPWHRVCKDPSMWRKIDIDNRDDRAFFKYKLDSMCRHAVDRSQGGLVEIEIWYYGTNDLIKYITDRSSNLKSLGLARCMLLTDEGVAKAVSKVPLLEELEVSYCLFTGESLRAIGQSCPNLKTLKLNRNPEIMFSNCGLDDNAKAIAGSMPELRHLQILGNGLTNKGLKAILDGCPHLEHLDIRECYNIDLFGDLMKRCVERIKDLRLPGDSTDNDSDGDEYFY
ncbi:PREDICTED: putative F-box/LRR-repeat protein 23 [Camelina sativa]|uniref:F-box/LRR-repeat protein 23 n=1 Tax=Camelina sativa TaxID=90675 RepID=A0ABM0T8E2_CAMSA|nr:PREDICTED: putative F-box/LRR-repeat protein 23 [Camelina sativa]